MKWVVRAAIAAAAVALAVRLAWPDARLVVHVFSVGQGDGILVQCGNGQLLVDGGPDNGIVAKLGSTMPFFDRTIETVVLTHPHADHYFGLVAVLRQYRVQRLILSGDDGGGGEYRALLAAAEAGGTETVIAQTGDVISVGECGRAEVLWPDRAQAIAHDTDDLNTQSVVLRVVRVDATDPRAAALLTGDANDVVEEALLRDGAPLTADLLKVGHHGSRSSSSPAFIDAVHPLYAAISLATKNRYGHPTPEALARFAERGIDVRQTDLEGDLRYVLLTDRVLPLR